jgi:hypothetical protein
MKFRYEIFPSTRTIVLQYSGKFTLARLMETTNQLWDDARYSRSFDGLVDLTASDLGVEMSDFRPLLDYLRQSPRTSEAAWAAIATSPLATACGFIYRNTIRHRHRFGVFSTHEAACDFIGVRLEHSDLFMPGNQPHRSPSAN